MSREITFHGGLNWDDLAHIVVGRDVFHVEQSNDRQTLRVVELNLVATANDPARAVEFLKELVLAFMTNPPPRLLPKHIE